MSDHRYEGSAHGGFGHALLLVSIGLALLDSLCLVKRTLLLRRESKHKWSTFVLDVFKRKTDDPLRSASANRYETVGLVQYCNDDEHLDSVFAFGMQTRNFIKKTLLHFEPAVRHRVILQLRTARCMTLLVRPVNTK